jgi:hypothetical protein
MKNLENAIGDVFSELGLDWTYMIEPNNIVTFNTPNLTKVIKVEFDINEDDDSMVAQVLEWNGITRQQMSDFMDKLLKMFDDPPE